MTAALKPRLSRAGLEQNHTAPTRFTRCRLEALVRPDRNAQADAAVQVIPLCPRFYDAPADEAVDRYVGRAENLT